MARRTITTAEVAAIEIAVPPGHRHLRTTLRLQNGEEIILQEATVAALSRAFLGVKTHPLRRSVRLVGQELTEAERKEGFASWQLLEPD